jgi:hypothetical protein
VSLKLRELDAGKDRNVHYVSGRRKPDRDSDNRLIQGKWKAL